MNDKASKITIYNFYALILSEKQFCYYKLWKR